jgi:hypothetical protein
LWREKCAGGYEKRHEFEGNIWELFEVRYDFRFGVIAVSGPKC